MLAGVGYGLLAYTIWGFFPLFFRQLDHVPPAVILVHRAFWACLFVSLLLSLGGHWAGVRHLLRQPSSCYRLTLAGLLVGSNWLIFLWAVAERQVVASSLGYFLTPLVNILLGLLVLRERLDLRQWAAVGLALAALANELLTLGSLPWISLLLALTFGTYGLVRKQVSVDALTGLWLETLAMLPFCLLYIVWMALHGTPAPLLKDTPSLAWLIAAGGITALPLLAFAAATRRLNLATVGMLMYINPTLQFATAVLLFDERLQPARLLSFALIWLGLLLFTWSAWQRYRTQS